MSNRTARDQIMGEITAAMDEAEGIGGPEGEEYAALMQEIADLATSRLRTFRNNTHGTTNDDDLKVEGHAHPWDGESSSNDECEDIDKHCPTCTCSS